MEKRNIYKDIIACSPMKKRGEIVITIAIISFIVVAGSIIAGSYLITTSDYQISSENKYIGNVQNKEFHNMECIYKIPKEDRIFFKNYIQAEDLNFTYSESCPK